MKRKQTLNFETNLVDLERLVARMEQGDLTLEESLLQFEQGIGLIRACQQALQSAEQKVQILTQTPQGEVLTDFEAPQNPDDNEDED